MKSSPLFLVCTALAAFGSSAASAGVPSAKSIVSSNANAACSTAKDCSCNAGWNASCLNNQCRCSSDADLRAERRSTADRAPAVAAKSTEKSHSVSMGGGTHAEQGGANHHQN